MRGSVPDIFLLRILTQRKKRVIRQKIGLFHQKSQILFLDESDFLLFPPLRATWSRRGKSQPVLLTGRNQKSVLFAAFNPKTGRILTAPMPRQTGESFCLFLSLVRGCYRRGKILILLDSDSSHTAAQSLTHSRDLGIELVFLPFRSPHLNPVEHLWRHIKAGVCSNHQFSSIEAEMAAVQKFIHDLPPRSLQVLAGITTPDFWIPSLQMRM
jgi:transposase